MLDDTHDPAHEETERLVEQYADRARREYLRAFEEASAKLEDYMDRFAAKDAIWADKVERGEATEGEYREWRRNQMLVGDRWQELVDTLAADYANADRIAVSMAGEYLPDAYALNHDYGTFQVEKATGMDTSYTLYDRSTVERLIRDQPDLLPRPSVNMARDTAWNRRHLASAITQGVLQGESIPKVARRMREVADMDYRAALRTARTAMTSAQNAGRIDSYRRAQGMGISMRKTWLATMDRRTRSSHVHLDMETVEVDEAFSNGLKYPGDPDGPGAEVYNCRCTMIPAIDGVEYENPAMVRNSKLGGMTWEEWKEGAAQRAAAAGARRVADLAAVKRVLVKTDRPVVKWEEYDNRQKEMDVSGIVDMGRQQASSMDEAQQSAMLYYTRSGYLPMNKYKRGKSSEPVKEKAMNAIRDLDRAMESTVTDRDLFLRRNNGSFSCIRDLMDAIGVDERQMKDDPQVLVGRAWKDEGYLSSTIKARGDVTFGGEVIMHLYAPEGTHGIHIGGMSAHSDEMEFLFQAGQPFVIRNAEYADRELHIWAEAAV